MFLVGLTGGIASGKSTVSKLFADHGIPVIDSDQIARQVVEPGKKAWHEIRRHFGADVFHDDGTLDRQKLGKLIFEDADKRKLLNKITHPKIHKQMIFSVLKCLLQGYHFVVLDVPLLFEGGNVIHYVDKIITVYCDDNEQLQRLQKRNDMPEKDAKNRMAAQMPLEKKCQLSDFVIDNNGSMESTREQTEKVISYLQSLNLHWTNRIRWILLAVAVLGFLALVSTGLWFLFTGALKKW